MATRVHHPVFARIYARFGRVAEEKGGAEHRDELLVGLTGRVIEVGAGNGLNFGHHPASVTEVVAVEPESYLRERAEAAAKDVDVPITVVDGTADRLPADDASCDAGVASLVLCSVDDQAIALAELRRVIRPGGELRFYEHVVSDRPRLARVQRALDRTVWPWRHRASRRGGDRVLPVATCSSRRRRPRRSRRICSGRGVALLRTRQLRDPDLPHILLTISQVLMIGGAPFAAMALRRRPAREPCG